MQSTALVKIMIIHPRVKLWVRKYQNELLDLRLEKKDDLFEIKEP